MGTRLISYIDRVGNKIKIKLEDSYYDKSSHMESESGGSTMYDERLEQHVISMLEEGERKIFKIIYPDGMAGPRRKLIVFMYKHTRS